MEMLGIQATYTYIQEILTVFFANEMRIHCKCTLELHQKYHHIREPDGTCHVNTCLFGCTQTQLVYKLVNANVLTEIYRELPEVVIMYMCTNILYVFTRTNQKV